jgi:group I intron endonuclease
VKEEDNMICIYKIENIKNGKLYIGSTEDFERRMKEHLYELRTGKHVNPYLQNAYDKHGIDIFSIDVVERLDSINNLIEREQYWIDFLEAHYTKKGYNLSPTAGRTTGYRYTDEQREALSAIIKERYDNMSAEHKQFISSQLSKALKGKKKPEGFGNQVRERLLDKAQPYSVKDNMSKAHTGSNNSRAKLNEEQVYQIKLKLMEGKTIKQLSEEHGVSRDAITDIRREESWTVVQVPGFNEWASRTIKRRKLDY